MKERGILFTDAMVRALLAGTKTQTRRIVKITHRTPGLAACLMPPAGLPMRPAVAAQLCPYGQPSDGLWVREAWHFLGTDMMRHGRTHSTQDGVVGYRDGERRTINTEWQNVERLMSKGDRWRPSIHMPRWASRITLEITGVRVERLQDISAEDAMAEGISVPAQYTGIGPHGPIENEAAYGYHPVDEYMDLWESINGPGSWAANPWVWVVAFRRVTP